MNSNEEMMEKGTPKEYKAYVPAEPHQLYNVAKYMDRDPDHWIVRRFDKLQILNILFLQQRLNILEGEFKRRTTDVPQCCDDLVPDLQHTLKEYNDALAAQAKLKSYLEPEARVLKNVDDWSQKHEEVLRDGLNIPNNKKFTEDMVAIGAIDKTWVHKFIDRHRRLYSLFEEKKNLESRLWSTLIYHEKSVLLAEAAFIHMCICGLLLCPVVGMLYLEKRLWKIVVMAVSLFAISVLSVGLLNTTNKAGLALVVGYAAILTVFLSSNVGS